MLPWSRSQHCKRPYITYYGVLNLVVGHSFCIRLGCVVHDVKLTMCNGCDKSCQKVEYMVYSGIISSLFLTKNNLFLGVNLLPLHRCIVCLSPMKDAKC